MLQALIRTQPFAPFRLVLADGSKFDVTSSEHIAYAGGETAFVAYADLIQSVSVPELIAIEVIPRILNADSEARAALPMARYFAHISTRGPVKYGSVPSAIGVLEQPDRFMPIGEASCVTWDDDNLGLWVLRVGGQQLPDLWVIVDGECKPTGADQPGIGGPDHA
jgi:hypothetical protein